MENTMKNNNKYKIAESEKQKTKINSDKKLPPVTKELLGIAEIVTDLSDKNLLIDALKKKHLK